MDVMGLSQNHSRHSPIPVSQAVFPPFPILSANRVSYHPRNPAAASLGKKKIKKGPSGKSSGPQAKQEISTYPGGKTLT